MNAEPHIDEVKREELRQTIAVRIGMFPSMPVFVSEILSKLHDRDVDIIQLSEKIRVDPGMTANVLRLANSAQFGAIRSIGSLHEAIVRLGMKQLFQMVVALGITRHIAKPLPGYELVPEELFYHSLWTALAAEELCKTLNIKTPDLLFTAGLLHDLGKLVMDEFVQEYKDELLTLRDQKDGSFEQLENEIFGINHAEAGALIIDGWNFPTELVAAAKWHHAPEEAGEYKPLAAVVHIAEFLAYSEGVGTGIDGLTYHLSSETISDLGLKTKTIEYVASQVPEKMKLLGRVLNTQ